MSLSQYNNNLNIFGGLLDLIISNRATEVSRSAYPLVVEDNYHPALEFNITLSRRPRDPPSDGVLRRDYTAGDYKALHEEVSHIDWTPIYSSTDVNYCVDYLTSALNETIDRHVPMVGAARTSYPSWFSSELRFLIKKKNYNYRKYHSTGKQIYSNLHRMYRRMASSRYQLDEDNYMIKVDSSLKHDPKLFWAYVNEKRSDRKDCNSILSSNDPSSEANLFADHFRTVFVSSSTYAPASTPDNDCSIKMPAVTIEAVKKAIKNLKPKKSTGMDRIPSFIIKGLSNFMAPILAAIFSKSLASSIFPTLWKSSIVVPVFKSGVRSCVSNYRPISLSCVFSKIFESVIHSYLFPVIDPLLSPRQHGFRPKRSTVTNLNSFLSFVGPHISNRRQVDAVFLDMSKAFDRVDHGLLLSKLETFNFHSSFISWFSSYLSNRQCCVRSFNVLSTPFTAISGVPQGSILGPLLFLMFINDICSNLTCYYELFADDVKLYMLIDSTEACRCLQQNIDKVLSWSNANNMDFNVSKSNVVRFSRSSSQIRFPYSLDGVLLLSSNCVRDLGVLLDYKLKFVDHISSITVKAQRVCGLLRYISARLSLESTVTLYKSIVRPILEYAAIVWNDIGVTRAYQIEQIQRRFIRFLYCRYMYRRVFYSYEYLCVRLGLEPLFRRRMAFEALYVIRSLAGLTICSHVESNIVVLPMGRRAGRFLYIPQLSSVCPLVRCVSSVNSLICSPLTILDVTSLRSVLSYLP